MTRVLLLFLLVCGQIHAQTAAQIKASVGVLLPNNTSRSITPAKLRESFDDVIDGVGSTSFTITGFISSTNISVTNLSATYITGNIIPSGGVSPVSLVSLSQPVNILAFGAKCDNVTDDSAAFAAAFNSTVSLSLIQPPTVCKINTPLTYDISKVVGYDGNGGGWDMSSITSATTSSASVVQVVNTGSNLVTGASGYEYRPVFKNLMIFGRTSSSVNSALGGISFTNVNNISTYGLAVDGFTYCHGYGTNAYLIQHHAALLNHCNGVVEPSGGSNYGENLAYFGGRMTNVPAGGTGFDLANSNGDIKAYGTSFDINAVGARFVSLSAGSFTSAGNHFENITGNNAVSPVISIGDADSAFFASFGDRLLMGGSPPYTGGSSTVFVGRRGMAVFCGLDFNSTNMVSGSFITGTGKVMFCPGTTHFGSVSNNNSNVITISNTFANLLSDGDFEQSTAPVPPKDLWTIRADTTGYVISRTTGSNISITTVSGTANTGNQYMAVSKASGSTGSWRLYVMIPRQSTITGSIFYQKPTTQTGAWFASTYLGQCTGPDSNGIPTTVSETLLGTTTIASTSATIPWTQLSIPMQAAERAQNGQNCFIWDFNGNSLGAGEVDFDTGILTAI